MIIARHRAQPPAREPCRCAPGNRPCAACQQWAQTHPPRREYPRDTPRRRFDEAVATYLAQHETQEE